MCIRVCITCSICVTKGKKTLEVVRDEFVLGSKENDWAGVVKEFNDQIKANTEKDTYDILDPGAISTAN